MGMHRWGFAVTWGLCHSGRHHKSRFAPRCLAGTSEGTRTPRRKAHGTRPSEKTHTGSNDALRLVGLAVGAACHVPGWPVARIPSARRPRTRRRRLRARLRLLCRRHLLLRVLLHVGCPIVLLFRHWEALRAWPSRPHLASLFLDRPRAINRPRGVQPICPLPSPRRPSSWRWRASRGRSSSRRLTRTAAARSAPTNCLRSSRRSRRHARRKSTVLGRGRRGRR